MREKTFTPLRDDALTKSLRRVNPTQLHVQCLHPLIAERLTKTQSELSAADIVRLLCEAIDEFATTFFPRTSTPSRVSKLMWLRSYIEAVVPERVVRVRALVRISSGYPDPD